MAFRISEAESASLCASAWIKRQRRLALGEVVADVLAELLGIAAIVEGVVDQLEGDAEMLAVVREGRLDLGGGARDDCRDLRAGFEQPRGLAVDDFHVPDLGRVRVAGVHELHDFAGSDRVGRVGHDADDARRVERGHHLESARVEEVADQNRGGIPERIVRRLAAPPAGRLVDDVVVQQGRRMDELDERGGLDVGRIPVAPAALDGQHDEQGTQALAAAARRCSPRPG